MDMKKIGIICIALAVLAYAQALEQRKPESYTATSISPLEIGQHEESQEAAQPESFTATTVSPFENVPETQERPLEAAVPEIVAENQGNSTDLEEVFVIYIDEDGNEVDYDKNLYFCENCEEAETNENNDKKKLVYFITDEELAEVNENGDYEIEDDDEDVDEEQPQNDDEEALDFMNDDDNNAEEDVQYDDEDFADETNEDDDEGSGF